MALQCHRATAANAKQLPLSQCRLIGSFVRLTVCSVQMGFTEWNNTQKFPLRLLTLHRHDLPFYHSILYPSLHSPRYFFVQPTILLPLSFRRYSKQNPEFPILQIQAPTRARSRPYNLASANATQCSRDRMSYHWRDWILSLLITQRCSYPRKRLHLRRDEPLSFCQAGWGLDFQLKSPWSVSPFRHKVGGGSDVRRLLLMR
jgi:hypothetical protein